MLKRELHFFRVQKTLICRDAFFRHVILQTHKTIADSVVLVSFGATSQNADALLCIKLVQTQWILSIQLLHFTRIFRRSYYLCGVYNFCTFLFCRSADAITCCCVDYHFAFTHLVALLCFSFAGGQFFAHNDVLFSKFSTYLNWNLTIVAFRYYHFGGGRTFLVVAQRKCNIPLQFCIPFMLFIDIFVHFLIVSQFYFFLLRFSGQSLLALLFKPVNPLSVFGAFRVSSRSVQCFFFTWKSEMITNNRSVQQMRMISSMNIIVAAERSCNKEIHWMIGESEWANGRGRGQMGELRETATERQRWRTVHSVKFLQHFIFFQYH